MADGLVLRIGADVTPAVQGLQQVEQRMRSTVAAGQSFGKGIDKSVQSLSKLPGSSNQATQSLINLSRVAQDAPYGFIGIANNLNPLLESFQRLKASTGTTGGALQALKGALIGPAGVGLAIGVVSSLMVTFGDRLFSASASMSKMSKVVSEAKDEFVGAKKEIESLRINIDLAKQGILSKQQVIKQYNDSLGKAAGSVKTLEEAEASLIKNGDAYVQMTLQKAIANTAFVKQAEAEFSIAQNNIRVQTEYSKQVGIAGLAQDIATKKVAASNERLQKQADQYKQIGVNASKAAADISKNFGFNNTEVKPKSISIKPEKVDLDFSLAKYGRLELPVGTAVLRMQELLLDKPKQLTFAETLQNSLTEKISKLVVTPNIKVAENKELKKQAEERVAMHKQEAAVITSVLTPAFDSMFNALAQGGNAFKAFGQAAIQALTQLIGKLVTTAAIAAILGPVLGIGTTALGSATNSFKDVFGSLFGGFRAAGGPVEAGRAYITGEAGRELFVPSVSGSIVPNHQIGSFSTGRGSSSGGSMRAIVRGQNILLAVARTTRGNSRLGLNGI